MERGSKRKAAAMASPAADPRSAKRAKSPDDSSTPVFSSVRETGLHFLDQLRRAVDKTGRQIASHFLELPDKDEYPDYYDTIELPLAIDTLENKLKNDAYPDVTAFEADVKRMINNAKKYNDSRSEVYADAERIRKNTFNFMAKHNPAYADKSHHTAPTPIPEEGKRLRLTLTKPDRTPSRPPTTVSEARSEKQQTENRFKGMSLQQAEAAIMEELIHYSDPNDDEGLEIFTPFQNLPNRQDLPDYYQVITAPTSLRGILKRTSGNHGRQGKTGITDFKTWEEFEVAVARIWENARTYNEDGSEIFELAGEFEEMFKSILAEAKQVVDSPTTTIKLNMGNKAPTSTTTGMKIKLGGAKGSPVPTSSTPLSNGVTVDEQALLRQRAHVQAGINGNVAGQLHAVTNGGSGSPVPPPKAETPGANGLTNGHHHGPQMTNGTMLPPSATRPGGGSPYPPSHVPQPPVSHAPVLTENKLRPEGKTEVDALYEYINLGTHPDLSSTKPYRMTIMPDPRLAHQTVTSSIPAAHSHLRLAPSLAASLGPSGRPFKIFVNVS